MNLFSALFGFLAPAPVKAEPAKAEPLIDIPVERQRLIRIAEWLEAGGDGERDARTGNPLRFNMATWYEPLDCGTVCCIGGAVSAFYPKEVAALQAQGIPVRRTAAGILLGMPDFLSERALFMGRNNSDGYGPGMFSTTPARAAAVIRNYLATGEVDWRVA